MNARLALELLILLGCVSVYPLTVVLLVHQKETLSPLFHFLARGMFSGGSGPWGTSIWLWVKILAPYIVVQFLRLTLWLTGKSFDPRWFLLLSFAIFAAFGGLLLWKALDLLYFMHVLGDLPDELAQFWSLEWRDLFIGTASTVTAWYSLSLFFHERRR
jgi:hypothetical protein